MDVGTSKITIGGYNSGEPNLINSNARYGIKIGGANEICDIINNTIHLKQSATDGAEVWGIWVDDSHKTDVIDNTVDGDQGGTVESLNKRAITLTASPGSTVSCNHTDNTGKGLEFLDDCSNSKIRAKTMEEHTDGLAIGSSYPTGSEIGNQLMFTYQNTDYVPGDYWKGNGTAHSITNETHIYDNLNAPQFQVPDNTYLAFYNPVNNVNDIGTAISPNVEPTIPPYDDCEASVGFNNEELEFDYYLWESIADNSYGYGYREEVLAYNLKKSLFEQIKKNDDLMRDHSILEDFYDATKDQVIGSFYLVDSLIGLLSDTSIDEISKEFIVESALSENDAVDATQIFELNEQAFNHIYLNSIAKHAYPFDIGTEGALFDIANQCPYDGGKSVFKARNLYSLINPGHFFDDMSLCDTAESPRITNQIQGISFNIYPNPTSNTVAISYTITDHRNVDFVVENILNETIYKVRVNPNNTIMSLDFKDQAAGVYLFKFQEESAMLGSGKIIVIH